MSEREIGDRGDSRTKGEKIKRRQGKCQERDERERGERKEVGKK